MEWKKPAFSNELLEKGHFGTALMVLSTIMRETPLNLDCLLQIVFIQIKLGNYDTVVQYCRHGRGLLKRAEKKTARVLQLESSFQYYEILGLIGTGQLVEAETLVVKAFGKVPSMMKKLMYRIGMAKKQLVGGDYDVKAMISKFSTYPMYPRSQKVVSVVKVDDDLDEESSQLQGVESFLRAAEDIEMGTVFIVQKSKAENVVRLKFESELQVFFSFENWDGLIVPVNPKMCKEMKSKVKLFDVSHELFVQFISEGALVRKKTVQESSVSNLSDIYGPTTNSQGKKSEGELLEGPKVAGLFHPISHAAVSCSSPNCFTFSIHGWYFVTACRKITKDELITLPAAWAPRRRSEEGRGGRPEKNFDLFHPDTHTCVCGQCAGELKRFTPDEVQRMGENLCELGDVENEFEAVLSRVASELDILGGVEKGGPFLVSYVLPLCKLAIKRDASEGNEKTKLIIKQIVKMLVNLYEQFPHTFWGIDHSVYAGLFLSDEHGKVELTSKWVEESKLRELFSRFYGSRFVKQLFFDELLRCEACGCDEKGKLRRCSRCLGVFYCGRECQRKDWKRHKKECKKKT